MAVGGMRNRTDWCVLFHHCEGMTDWRSRGDAVAVYASRIDGLDGGGKYGSTPSRRHAATRRFLFLATPHTYTNIAYIPVAFHPVGDNVGLRADMRSIEKEFKLSSLSVRGPRHSSIL